MRDERRSEAQATWDALDDVDRAQVIGLLCRDRPEAVLGAAAALRRHRQVLEQLRAAPAEQTTSSVRRYDPLRAMREARWETPAPAQDGHCEGQTAIPLP